jgi:hypothetical protein
MCSLTPVGTRLETTGQNYAKKIKTNKNNSMAWVRERTPLVGEVIANLCG